jgi:NADPH-dependent F420 reductase
MTQTIAVIGGTGREGPGLALRWAKSGRYQVLIGSRQQEKAERVAAELNARLGRNLIRGMVNPDAAAAADMVVLTVPYSAHVPTLESIRAGLRGKILVDVTVPLQPPQVSRVHIPPGGSAAAEAQALLGSDVRVVAAFQNVGAAHLQDPDHTIESDVLVCGDDKEAKAEVIALAEAAGMRGLDAGPLQNAVVVEGLTAVLIGINIRYKAKRAGIRVTGIDQGVGSRE